MDTDPKLGASQHSIRARLTRAALFMAAALAAAWAVHNFGGDQRSPPVENLPSLVTVLPLDVEIAEAVSRRLDRERRRFSGRMLVVALRRDRDADLVARLRPESTEAVQIFLDADGRELGRRAGVLGTDALVEHWRKLGVDLAGEKR